MNYILDSKEIHDEDPLTLLTSSRCSFTTRKEKEVRLYGDAPQSDETAGAGGVGQFECRRQNEECRIMNASREYSIV